MKKILIILTTVIVSACAGFNTVETTVMDSEGKQIMAVKSKDDAMVKYENGAQTLTVDNRGEASTLRTVVDAMLVKTINDVE